MRSITVIVIGLLSLLLGASAHAEETKGDGNELFRFCAAATTPSITAKSAWCLGYLFGFDDIRRLSALVPDLATLCMPEEVTMEQAQSVVVKYLLQHPETLHHPRVVLVHLALKEAFPCPAQPVPK